MKVSYVVPAFNAAAWLPMAVDSVLKQEWPKEDLELIIVNDCSTDSTREYLEWLAMQGDERVVIVHNEKNLGRSASRNLGNEMATGDFVFVLDADDAAFPKRTKLTVAKFKDGVEFVYGSADVMGPTGEKWGEMKADVFNKSKALETLENKIVHSTVSYTKDFSKRYLYRDSDIARLGIDDWDQQIRAALDGVKFDFVPSTLSAYRMLRTAISNQRDPHEALAAKKKVLEGLKQVA